MFLSCPYACVLVMSICLLFTTLLFFDNVAYHGSKLVQRRGQEEQEGKLIPPRTFVFFHCYELLCNKKKWKNRDGVDALAKN